MKKIFLALMAITLLSPVYAWGLQFGMAGAVKAQVTELDKKIKQHGPLTGAPLSGTLRITSFKTTLLAAPAKMAPSRLAPPASFTHEPNIAYGYNNAGAPDYITVTLKEVEIRDGDRRKTVWSGSREFTIDGSGDVDTSGITLDLVESNIDKVVLYFDNNAKIKGTLNAKFNMGPGLAEDTTFYTKAAWSYDSYTHTGGADSYTSFTTGPAEEAAISLSLGGDSNTMVEIPVLNGTIDPAHSKLTVAVDINRMLRFYNGLNTSTYNTYYPYGGVNPSDPANKAYFYCHSVFSSSVGAFIGDPGTVQGYQTIFAAYDDNGTTFLPGGIPGWMTIIYDAGGNFLSGMLIGDNDNDLSVAKGSITSYSADGSFVYDIDYGQNVFKVDGFAKQTVVGATSPVATWQKTHSRPGDHSYHGEATFKLQFQR